MPAPRIRRAALAWFAIAAEFERQTNRGEDTPLAKTADQRSQTLQRVLTPAELQRAQQLGQAEFRADRRRAGAAAQAQPATGRAGTAARRRRIAAASGRRTIRRAGPRRRPSRSAPSSRLGRSPASARQAGRRSGADDAQCHPRLPAQRGPAHPGEPSKEVYLRSVRRWSSATSQARRCPFRPSKSPPRASRSRSPPSPSRPAPVAIDLGNPEPPPAPPTTADLTRDLPSRRSPRASRSRLPRNPSRPWHRSPSISANQSRRRHRQPLPISRARCPSPWPRRSIRPNLRRPRLICRRHRPRVSISPSPIRHRHRHPSTLPERSPKPTPMPGR